MNEQYFKVEKKKSKKNYSQRYISMSTIIVHHACGLKKKDI